MSDDKVVEFPGNDDNHGEDGVNAKVIRVDNVDNVEDVMRMLGMQMPLSGIAPPFTIYPGRDDLSGVAARAAVLRFADIIAHEALDEATNLRKIVLDIETQLGRPTN